MNTPQIQRCRNLSDLPDLRAGGVVYMVLSAADGGLSTYLAAKGWTVEQLVVGDKILYDYSGVTVRTLPSATRLIVAVGGHAAMEVGKLIAHNAQLPLWCVPTDCDATGALWCHTLWTVDGTPTFVPTEPHTLLWVDTLLRPTRDGAQQAYQYLFAALAAMESARYRNRMLGREEDNEALAAPIERARQALDVKEYGVDVGKRLWEALETCATCDVREIELLALAICMYKKKNMPYNRYILLAAYSLWVALAECKPLPDLYLPPDRQAALESLRALGWRAAAAKAEDADYRRVDWVWRDYLEEMANPDIRRYARYWRRIAGGAGYGYFEDLTAAEVVALLPVVAELTPTYTPFKHLYLRGNLNLFI